MKRIFLVASCLAALCSPTAFAARRADCRQPRSRDARCQGSAGEGRDARAPVSRHACRQAVRHDPQARHPPRRHHVEHSVVDARSAGRVAGLRDRSRPAARRRPWCRPHDRSRAVHPVHLCARERPHRRRRRGLFDHAAARAGRRLQQPVRGFADGARRAQGSRRTGREPSRREDRRARGHDVGGGRPGAAGQSADRRVPDRARGCTRQSGPARSTVRLPTPRARPSRSRSPRAGSPSRPASPACRARSRRLRCARASRIC